MSDMTQSLVLHYYMISGNITFLLRPKTCLIGVCCPNLSEILKNKNQEDCLKFQKGV